MKDIETFFFGNEVLILTRLVQGEIRALLDLKSELADKDLTCGDIDNRLCYLRAIIDRLNNAQSC